ncbi:helix-turn-helix domain-containing protein [Isoptericola hypogeus]|uniref:Helix-turn-helix domain-containing protein n=1 Tax=Isoptericola hypogeus TaxID=300179 RepID=A0ABP4VGM2_9MICO
MIPEGSRAGQTETDDDLVFKALASPVRRRMLDALKESTRTTGELCDRFPGLDRTTVLQHLRVLERADLVIGRKVGRERHLALAPLPIKRIHDRWIGEYARAAVDLLDRLDEPSTMRNHQAEHADGPGFRS